MKIIGVPCKKDNSNSKESFVVRESIYNYIKRDNIEVIGLMCEDDKLIDEDLLSICNGFVFPGGSNEFCGFHKQIFDHAYRNNKPVLGICLGMQFMGIYSKNESIYKQVNEFTDDTHFIDIKERHNITIVENSFLYNIFGSNLMVNSTHNQCITEIGDLFEVTAKSDDGIIEAIELKDKSNFFVGVQFHPEKMDNMEPLMDEFIKYL